MCPRRDDLVVALQPNQRLRLWESIDIGQDTFDASTQRVYDLSGRLVNTNHLAPGIYIIQDLKGDKVKTKKIVIH
jgi:hypothetical protein